MDGEIMEVHGATEDAAGAGEVQEEVEGVAVEETGQIWKQDCFHCARTCVEAQARVMNTRCGSALGMAGRWKCVTGRCLLLVACGD